MVCKRVCELIELLPLYFLINMIISLSFVFILMQRCIGLRTLGGHEAPPKVTHGVGNKSCPGYSATSNQLQLGGQLGIALVFCDVRPHWGGIPSRWCFVRPSLSTGGRLLVLVRPKTSFERQVRLVDNQVRRAVRGHLVPYFSTWDGLSKRGRNPNRVTLRSTEKGARRVCFVLIKQLHLFEGRVKCPELKRSMNLSSGEVDICSLSMDLVEGDLREVRALAFQQPLRVLTMCDGDSLSIINDHPKDSRASSTLEIDTGRWVRVYDEVKVTTRRVRKITRIQHLADVKPNPQVAPVRSLPVMGRAFIEVPRGVKDELLITTCICMFEFNIGSF